MSDSAVTWRILAAPASFKGSLTAAQAGEAIRRGLLQVLPSAEVHVVPLGDGGEGTVEALYRARGGTLRKARVTGPLGEETVEATWAVLDGNGPTAVIEMAQASGLPLVPLARRDPLVTTTAGTGELLREALDAGVEHILVGLGGSATVDGGLGLARVLGFRLLDRQGRPVPPGGRGLLELHRIDAGNLDPRLARVRVTALADVESPLVGPDGAAVVFGPQKGADDKTVELLARGLENFARIATRDLDLSVDLTTIPGGGAAGGLGAGLVAFCGAEIISGIDYVMEAAGLAGKAASADLVLTGEGQLDGQSPRGKACAGVARVARLAGRPVIVLVGSVRGEGEAVEALGLDGVLPVTPGPMTLIQAMEGAEIYVEEAAARLARLLLAGRRIFRSGSPAREKK